MRRLRAAIARLVGLVLPRGAATSATSTTSSTAISRCTSTTTCAPA